MYQKYFGQNGTLILQNCLKYELSDQYDLFIKTEMKKLQRMKEIKDNGFYKKIKNPGVYKVGGLGACTLISKDALSKGVSYSEIYI